MEKFSNFYNNKKVQKNSHPSSSQNHVRKCIVKKSFKKFNYERRREGFVGLYLLVSL